MGNVFVFYAHGYDGNKTKYLINTRQLLVDKITLTQTIMNILINEDHHEEAAAGPQGLLV